MKKNWNSHFPLVKGRWLKSYWLMRNFIILFFVFNLSAFANGFSQKVSQAQYENSTLVEVFEHLMGETGYGILYKKSEISPNVRVNLDVENSSVQDILDEVLLDTELSYKIQDEVIVIFHQEKPAKPILETPQEKKKVKGTVLDEDGNTLPGVSVVVKGTTIGAATDIDGNYVISFDRKNAILVYSFVGMIPQEIAYTGQEKQNVTLIADSEQMAEVVVTGYQTISKERATGSFVTLDSGDMSNSPNETIGDNLESLVVGIQTRVDEDGVTKIAIRGESSLLQESPNPLIVVDGFPISGGFETINRNDIDKVTVLKDAAAASIWGARAANGVIVITTKKGNRNKGIQVEVEAYTKFSEDVDLDYANPIANSESQLKYELMLWEQGLTSPSTGFRYIRSTETSGHNLINQHLSDGGTLANFSLNTLEAQALMKKSYKKQVKDLMLRKASSQNYNISLRGQGERNKYSLSVMYNKSNKVMRSDHNDNVLINFRNVMKVRDWLDFDIGLMTQIKNEKTSGISLASIKNMSAYETLLDENGNYAHVSSNAVDGASPTYNVLEMEKLLTHVDGFPYNSFLNNPLQNMRSQNFKTKTLNHRINGGLKIKLAEGINVKSSFQYERGSMDVKNIYGEDSYFTRNLVNTAAITDYEELFAGNPYTITEYQVAKGQIAYLKNIQTSSFLFRNQFSLDKVYGEHSFNFIAGSEISWDRYETKDDWLYGYDPRNIQNTIPESYSYLENALAQESMSLERGGEIKDLIQKRFSLYTNLAYTFKDKYTLSGSVRTDASNIIVDDPKYRYSPFWSVGGSWQITKEDFIKNQDWLNRLILKATYGVNGNSPALSARVPIIQFWQGDGYGAGADYAELEDLGNPTLGWEKVKQLNLALDFAVLGNKLFGSIELYDKRSEDLLASISLASTDGTNSQYFNGAAMSNKGIELNLNANLKIGNVKWRPIFNFASNKNKVTQVKEVDVLLSTMDSKSFVEGYPHYPLWYYKYNGANADGVATVIGKNGIVYDANTNISGTGVSGPDILWNAGSIVAPTVASLTNEFSYKGFSLLTTITSKFGHKMNVSGFNYNTRSDTQNYHENLEAMLRGESEGVGEFPLPTEEIPNYSAYLQTAKYLESRVEDASYIRFKEIMLSYSIPKSMISKIGFEGIKLYTHVSNVGLLWTANDEDIDPDYPKNGSFFKPERTYTFGVKLNF